MADVTAEIDKHYAWYGVDGIFLDEVSSSCTVPSLAAYYGALHAYVKAKGGTVVLNPGTRAGECYMAASDVLITFEGTYADYVGWTTSGWESSYQASRFWHLVMTASAAELPNAVTLSRGRNAGWIYVTDDNLDEFNPWDSLPSYWTQELAAVAG